MRTIVYRSAGPNGMQTLRMAAINKLAEGMTSMEEIVRSTAAD